MDLDHTALKALQCGTVIKFSRRQSVYRKVGANMPLFFEPLLKVPRPIVEEFESTEFKFKIQKEIKYSDIVTDAVR